MKAVILSLLVLTGILEALSLASWNPDRASIDYDDIVGYVLKVEKEGFRQQDFDKFALDRKVMRKEVKVGPAISRMFNTLSLFTLVASLGVLTFKFYREKKEPNQASEPTAPSGRGSP